MHRLNGALIRGRIDKIEHYVSRTRLLSTALIHGCIDAGYAGRVKYLMNQHQCIFH
jgi:hypothetical protein